MSQGDFVSARYASQDGTSVFGGQLQPETLALTVTGGGATETNTSTLADINQAVSFSVSKNNNEYGCKPRMASFKFADQNDIPDGYKQFQSYRLPIMRQSVAALVKRGATGTYLGKAIEYIRLLPEQVR